MGVEDISLCKETEGEREGKGRAKRSMQYDYDDYRACNRQLVSQGYDREDVSNAELQIRLSSCLDGWLYLKVIGRGAQSVVLQVCRDPTHCNYALKIMTREEAQYSFAFADTGISPPVYETIPCVETYTTGSAESSYGVVLRKMDGDMSSFYPFNDTDCPVFLEQMFDLMYRTVYDYYVNHNDTKINNFLWSRVKGSDSVRIYLADWGVARDIEDRSLRNLDRVFGTLVWLLDRSYRDPNGYGAPDNDVNIRIGNHSSDVAALVKGKRALAEWEVCFLSIKLSTKYSRALYGGDTERAEDDLERARGRLELLRTGRYSTVYDSKTGEYTFSYLLEEEYGF